MARVVFAAAGFLGDVAPFVTPANRLVELGHDVTFLAPPGFRPALGAERFELVTYPLDFSPTGVRSDPENERLMRHPWLNQLRLSRYWMRRGFVADPAAATRALLDVLEDADLLVTHPTFGSATVPAAQHLDIPVLVGQLFPMLMRTSAWTPPLPDRNRNLGRRINRVTWTAMGIGSGLVMYDRLMNRYRRSLDVNPIRGAAMLSWIEAQRTVVMTSRHYFGQAPEDWNGSPLVGFSAWPGPAGQPLDGRVDRFIRDGDSPVLVCLGTSAAEGAGATFAAIGDGLRRRGLRSLMLVGSAANLRDVERHAGAFEFAPLPAVTGRSRAAVVSGALGTLAGCLTAGIPVVVLPQLFDQIWHGRRVEALGVGIMVTRPEQVPAAVDELLQDPSYTRRARELADKLGTEDGATALVAAVIDMV